MSYHHGDNAEIEVNTTRTTVWVNSTIDGSCIGRFSKKFGMDVHKTGTEQIEGKGECIHCTHTPGTKEDWNTFCRLMAHHYDVAVPSLLLEYPND